MLSTPTPTSSTTLILSTAALDDTLSAPILVNLAGATAQVSANPVPHVHPTSSTVASVSAATDSERESNAGAEGVQGDTETPETTRRCRRRISTLFSGISQRLRRS